jgi:hypothetical protein
MRTHKAERRQRWVKKAIDITRPTMTFLNDKIVEALEDAYQDGVLSELERSPHRNRRGAHR